MEKITDESGEITGYRAYSKSFKDLKPAEAKTQMDAIQGFHRRFRIFQSTGDDLEAANAADVSPNTKDPRVKV